MRNLHLFICTFFLLTICHGQAEKKLASKARLMIGKTDANSKKLNTLTSWDAVKYCAKKAEVITEKQSKSLKANKIVNANGFKVKSHIKIPSGYIIGFFQNNQLIHLMISTGNGKAVGVNNKKAIGIGADKKWEEVSLQQLKFKPGYGTFSYKGKTISMVQKPASAITDINYYKNNKPVKENTQNNGIVDRSDDRQNKIDEKNIKINDLKNAKWSKEVGSFPDFAFDSLRSQFPELKNWKQYVAKANAMLTGMTKVNGKLKFKNPNYTVNKYGDFFIYDKADKIVLRLDKKTKPKLMFKVKNVSDYTKYYESQVDWDAFQSLKNNIKNAKQEFKDHKADFKYTRWDQYAFHAQDLLNNISAKQNIDKAIKTKRVNGDLLYFNTKTKIFIAANKNNQVYTMLKPENGIAHYNSFISVPQGSIYDVVKLENIYESTSDVLDPTPNIEWSKTQNTTAESEYKKYKKDFPEIINWKDYGTKVISLIKTKTVAGKTTFTNAKLKVKRYGNAYLYDPASKIFIELDEKRLPITMRKMKSLKEFNDYFESQILWSSVEDKMNPVLNAKSEFKEYKKHFKYKLWDEYAYAAQNMIKDVVNKSKNNPKIHVQRNWKGHVIYYNETENILIAADRNNHVMTMFKPEGNGLRTYEIYASQLDPWETRQVNPNAQAEWNRLSSEYAIIKTGSNIYTKPGESFERPNQNDNPELNSAYDIVNEEDMLELNSVYDNVNEEDMLELNEDDSESDEMDIQIDMSIYNTKMLKKKTTDWSKKGSLPSVRVADLAFRKYKKEFKPGIQLAQYIAIAHNLKNNTPADAETKTLSDGNTVIYDFYSNLLGLYNPDGLPLYISKPPTRQKAFDEMN